MFEQAFKNIDDVLWKEAGCGSELDYTEQTSWLLFLKYLDGLEQDLADQAALAGRAYSYILDEPYRWETWASPKDAVGKLDYNDAMTGDDLRDCRIQATVPLDVRLVETAGHAMWSAESAGRTAQTSPRTRRWARPGEPTEHVRVRERTAAAEPRVHSGSMDRPWEAHHG